MLSVWIIRRARVDYVNSRLRNASISADERVALICEKLELGGY